MGPDQASELVRSLLMQALLLSAPLLILGCAVSVLLTLLQTLTGIQEQTITAVPRLLIVFTACMVSAPWFLRHAMSYTLRLWADFHRYLG